MSVLLARRGVLGRRGRAWPQVHQGVGAPGPPPLRELGGRVRGRRPGRSARGARRRRWAGTRRGRRGRASRRSPRSTARSRAARAAGRAPRRGRRCGPAARRRRPAPGTGPTSARPRARGIGSSVGVGLGQHLGRAGTAASGPSYGVGPAARARRTAATSLPPSEIAPASEICWPITARIAISRPSTLPGTRSPGRRRTQRAPSAGRPPSPSATATGSQSASSSRRHRSTAAPTSRRSSTASSQRTKAVPAASASSGPAGRSAARGRAPCGRVRVRAYQSGPLCLDARHQVGDEEAQQLRPGVRRPDRQPQLEAARRGDRAAGTRPRSSVGVLA